LQTGIDSSARAFEFDGDFISRLSGVRHIADLFSSSYVQRRFADPMVVWLPRVETERQAIRHVSLLLRAPATGILSEVLVKDGGSSRTGHFTGHD
jgi:hypothetical protein